MPFIVTPGEPTPTAQASLAGEVTIPHFAFPFRIINGQSAQVEQGTLDDIISCVRTVVQCPTGSCPELPQFGRPDLIFGQAPPATTALTAAIQAQEPRATEGAVAAALDQTGADWAITLTTSVAGTQ